MAKPFASSADLEEKRSRLEELASGVVAYTAEGDPNVGAVIGEEAVLAVDARATPTHAREWLDELRRITDKPIRYLVLTHYHAVRVLGAAAFDAQSAIAHEGTRRWILERGEADFESETRRFPRLFRDVESIPGLTHPNVSFTDTLRLDLGRREVELSHLGRGHTQGDVVVWLPDEEILFAGDLVEARAAPYMATPSLRSGRRRRLTASRRSARRRSSPAEGPPPARGRSPRRATTCARSGRPSAPSTPR